MKTYPLIHRKTWNPITAKKVDSEPNWINFNYNWSLVAMLTPTNNGGLFIIVL